MIFTDDNVDLPDELLTSLSSDRLVIFVGAGVSAKAYSGQKDGTYYPTFRQLVEQIANRLQKKLTNGEQRYLKQGFADRVLGEWAHDKCDVTNLAATILTENGAIQRLDLHRTLIRLFPTNSKPRIVTTNFDGLLIRAVEKEYPTEADRWKISVAPSLPPAVRFIGICFLHGWVDEPDEMILTDKDIGRAYMDEGWALKFAHNMFREFDVLFVGYSLEDPPLRYLSLALEGNTDRRRWAFVAAPNTEREKEETERNWKRRGVKLIWYPVKRNDHRALERTIDRWGADNAKSFLDRRNILFEYGQTNPEHLKPYELSRVKFFLQDFPLLRDFAKVDLDKSWFDRLLEWGHLDHLVKGAGEWSEADGVLCERLVDWIIDDPTELLSKLAPYKSTIKPIVFDQYCRHLDDGKAECLKTHDLRKTLEFFRSIIESSLPHKNYALWLKEILKTLIAEGHYQDVIWLFASILSTQTKVTKVANFQYEYAKLTGEDTGNIPEYQLEFKTNFTDQSAHYYARQYAREVLIPNIEKIGIELLYTLTWKFLELRAVQNRGAEHVFETHHYRAAIEPNDQDDHWNGPLHSLLNLIRDLWEELLKVDRAKAEAVYVFWRSISDGYIERLSIHALRKLVEVCNG